MAALSLSITSTQKIDSWINKLIDGEKLSKYINKSNKDCEKKTPPKKVEHNTPFTFYVKIWKEYRFQPLYLVFILFYHLHHLLSHSQWQNTFIQSLWT